MIIIVRKRSRDQNWGVEREGPAWMCEHKPVCIDGGLETFILISVFRAAELSLSSLKSHRSKDLKKLREKARDFHMNKDCLPGQSWSFGF